MTFRVLFLLPVLVAGHIGHTQQPNDPITTAEEHYHDAARAYLDGDNDRAEQTAESALTADPGNQKLKNLLDLIRQQQDAPDSNGDDDERDESEESDEQSPSNSDQQNNDDQPRNSDSDQSSEDSPPQGQGQPAGSSESPASEAQPQAGRMSRSEAARLLDAIGAEERLLLERIRRQPQRNPEKDW